MFQFSGVDDLVLLEMKVNHAVVGGSLSREDVKTALCTLLAKRGMREDVTEFPMAGMLDLRRRVDRTKKETIETALIMAGQNRKTAAKIMNVSLRSVFYGIRRYGLAKSA